MPWRSGALAVERACKAHRDEATRQNASEEVIDDIEMFDNSRRQHSYLGDVSANDSEAFVLVA